MNITPNDLPLYMKVQRAVAMLINHCPKKGYYGCFSGGKDSVVIKRLAEIAGIKVSWYYRVTTIDPPELIRFIKEHHKDVKLDFSKHGNLTNRMVEKGVFPTRRTRWCCAEYKENTPANETVLMGVRIAESPRRKDQLHNCFIRDWQKGKDACLPIRLWSDEDVWQFIREYKVPYCSLYDEGWKRLGCIGCPMQNRKKRLQEFERWPKYEQMWIRSFNRLWEKRAGTIDRNGNEWFGSREFKTSRELFNWWLMQ